MNSIEKEFFSEVAIVLKLILVMPATNAVSEKSFSALWRLKTWLRSTMSQSRLSWCMVLNVHKEKTDELPMITLLNEFIGRCETRIRTFGLENFFYLLAIIHAIAREEVPKIWGGFSPQSPPSVYRHEMRYSCQTSG